MARFKNEVWEAASWASIVSVATMAIVFIPFLMLGSYGFFYMVSNLMLLEFGIFLVLGGCLMARQPLRDEDRYDADGQPVLSWRWAIIGKKLLIASVFLLGLTGAFFLLGGLL